MNFKKYKTNLKVDGNHILSYNTIVAEINHATKTIHTFGRWSTTTTKHVNYVAAQLGYEIVKIVIDGKAV